MGFALSFSRWLRCVILVLRGKRRGASLGKPVPLKISGDWSLGSKEVDWLIKCLHLTIVRYDWVILGPSQMSQRVLISLTCNWCPWVMIMSSRDFRWTTMDTLYTRWGADFHREEGGVGAVSVVKCDFVEGPPSSRPYYLMGTSPREGRSRSTRCSL